MSIRNVTARVALSGALAGLGWSCAASPDAEIYHPPPRDVAEYLLAPAPAARPSVDSTIRTLYRRLLSGEAETALRREMGALDGLDGAQEAKTVLLAQLSFRDGDLAEASRLLGELSPVAASSAPAVLLRARVSELEDDPVGAYFLYEKLSADVAVAARRREAVRDEAEQRLLASVDRAMRGGQVAIAATEVERLEQLAGGNLSTFDAVVRVARAGGDSARELEAVRELAAARPEQLALQLRRGELEVEVGDAAAGLASLEALTEAHPLDRRALATLESARFTYRVANLPESVRKVAALPELSRADLALLLYWLSPQVRSVRPDATRIATDVLDHPAREEIVRVVNLGLMQIDEALHRFEPRRAATRGEAFTALARLSHRAWRAEDPCAFAVRRGWIVEAGDCLPAAPVSGREAVDWMRRAVVEAPDEDGARQ